MCQIRMTGTTLSVGLSAPHTFFSLWVSSWLERLARVVKCADTVHTVINQAEDLHDSEALLVDT